MQLTAVFIPSETGSPREVVAASETKVGLPSADRLTALLETVRLRLEGTRAGSRFPLVWRVGAALVGQGGWGWTGPELDQVIRDAEMIVLVRTGGPLLRVWHVGDLIVDD